MSQPTRLPTPYADLYQKVEELQAQARSRGSEPPSSGGGGSLEARIAKVEASVEHIERDVTEIKADLRRLLTFGIGAVAVLCGLLAHGFHWI
jgi:hypothetical protein